MADSLGKHDGGTVAELAYEDALVMARQYLYSCPPPPPEYVWVLKHGLRVAGGWFFWQRRGPLRFIEDPVVRFGGGPIGFTVRDDRTLVVHGLMNLPPEALAVGNR